MFQHHLHRRGGPAAGRTRLGRSGRPSSATERGSVSLLLATTLVLAALVGYGLARLGATAAQAAAAQAAADASALAGAEDGRPGAEAVARRNGAEVVAFVQDHLDVQVTVVRAGHTATARARWLPRGVVP